ncbi:hypothetical protein BC834DRAFT_889751 [Gloeopeniophorella convolvens]|nr:hypothetical protein BC834DRAFT_889751 [Gloeopeniophorella convolvens]
MPRRDKRRRSSRAQVEVPPPEEDEVEVISIPGDDGEPEIDPEEAEAQSPQAEEPEPENGEQNGGAESQVEVEAEIWDAFREEFHEAVEQLPLYLHRSYTLLRELDEQVTGRYNELLPSLQNYIELRRSLAGRNASPLKEENEIDSPSSIRQGEASPRRSKRRSESTKAPPASTTRQLLPQIGWLMEEVVRGSEEKVGLGQAAFDSVDRHIRLLDQAIREQEMSISVGLRQGTHPALLPDLAAPSRWARATRVTHSPIPGLSDDEEATAPAISADGDVTIGMATGSEVSRVSSTHRKGRKSSKKRKAESALSEAEVTSATTAPSTRGLRLRVPPLSAMLPVDAVNDPDEPRYCYCDRISFGSMIACDNDGCTREWFHLECVGLTEGKMPRKWYCRDCELLRKAEMHSRGRGR